MKTETTETAETPTRPLVKDLEEQARIAYLASLMGQRVRYALTREVVPLQRAFGEYMTMPWHTGRLEALVIHQPTIISTPEPAVRIERPPQAPFFNAIPNMPIRETIALGGLYDVEAEHVIQADQVFAANQPASAVVAPHSVTADSPDAPDTRGFGCEDLFEENEIGCPHCGHKLRVTLTATVRLADDDESEEER